MSTSYKIRLKRFNGTDYDTLNLVSDNIIMSSGNNLQTDYNSLDDAIDDIVYVGDDAPTDPNTKIWLDTDASGASAVNSVNGKAGTVVLDLDDIGFATLIWQNASPTSSFSAQTVPVNLTSYGFVLITYTVNAAATEYCSSIIKVGTGGNLGYSGGKNQHRSCVVATNGVTFGTGYLVNTYPDGDGEGGNRCLPQQIWGIKGAVIS